MNPRSFIKKIRLLFAEPGEDAPETQPATPPAAAPLPARSGPQTVTRAPKAAVKGPLVLEGLKEQSEWILMQIGVNAKVFVAFTESAKAPALPILTDVFLRQDVVALMLGYKIVSAAYRIQYKEPSREVLRMVRAAMVSMLLKAGRDHAHQLARDKNARLSNLRPLSLSEAEEHVRSAEEAVVAVVARLEQRQPQALRTFCLAVVPAFCPEGGEESEHYKKYGPTLENILAKTQEALSKRFSQATG